MTEVKPTYWSLSRRLVGGSPVWCTSSRVLRRSRPLTCMSLSGQGIGGSLVVYHPILVWGGAEVFIDTTAVVAGLVTKMEEIEFVPSLLSSTGFTNAWVRSVPFGGPLFDFTGKYGLGMSLVMFMITSIRQVTEKLEELSRWVGRRFCWKWLFRGIGVSTPLPRRTE